MAPKSRDLWSATFAGVLVTGILTAILDAALSSLLVGGGLLSSIAQITVFLGPFLGGAVAGHVLYGKVVDAWKAGALSGVLGVPFYFGFSDIIVVFGLITPPSQQLTQGQMQEGITLILMLSLIAGSFGGLIVGSLRHPSPEAMLTQPQPVPGAVAGAATAQTKYCVQCGGQLPSTALMCPHCNARQP